MRALLYFEVKKLLQNRVFIAGVLLLLALTCVLSFTTPCAVYRYADELDALTKACRNDSDSTLLGVREEIDRILRLSDEINTLRDEGQAEEAEALADQIDTARYAAYSYFLRLSEEAASYASSLQSVIASAQKQQRNLLLAGSDIGSFSVRYNEGVIRHYTKQLAWNLTLPTAYIRGWDVILTDSVDSVPWLLSLLLCGAVLYIPERAGMLPLIHTSKRGRGYSATAKLVCGCIACLLLTLCFALAAFLCVALRTGLSGGTLPLQSVLPLSPFRVSIFDGYLIRLGIRVTVGIAFLWIILLLSRFCRQYPAFLGLSGAWIGLSFAVHHWGVFHTHSVFRLLNLLDVADAGLYLTSWNAFRLGSLCVDYTLSLPWILAALLFLSGVGNFLHALRHSTVLSIPAAKEKKQHIYRTIALTVKRPKRPKKQNTLFSWEWKKVRHNFLTPLLLFILLCGELCVVYIDFAADESMKDAAYAHYMNEYAGMWTEEKSTNLEAERKRLTALKTSKIKLADAILNGECTEEECRGEIEAANDAEELLEVYDIVIDQDAYLREQTQAGKKVEYLYDTGWKHILEDGCDYLSAAVILLLCSGIFSDEYATGITEILSTTAKGRHRLFQTKIAFAVLVGALTAIYSLGLRLLFLNAHYVLPSSTAPVASIQGMEEISGTVLGTCARVLLFRFAGTILLALLCALLGDCFRASLPALLLTGSAIYLPVLVQIFGVDITAYSFSAMLNGLLPLTDPSALIVCTVYSTATILLLCCRYAQCSQGGK